MDVDENHKAYLQSSANLEQDESGRLWRLPCTPDMSPSCFKGVGPLKTAELTYATYSKTCYILLKNWKAKSLDSMIPQELIPTTPYSFALLERLASLSKVSKNLRMACHEMLLLYVQKRQDLIAAQSTPWLITTVDGSIGEQQINERLDGVMLADVAAVAQAVLTQSSGKRIERAEKARMEFQRSGQAASERVLERKHATREQSLMLQREIQDQRVGKIDLVDIKWSDEDIQGRPASRNVTTKKQLNKMIREQTAKSRLLGRHRALNTPAIAKQPKSKQAAKRAATLSEIASDLKKDDFAWHDTDSEEDEDRNIVETQRGMISNPDELEPGRRISGRNWKKDKIPANVRSYIDGVGVKNDEQAPETRDSIAKKKQHNEWLQSVLDSSVRLPSERFDFSTLGKLQSGTAKKEINDMGSALDDMMNDT